MYSAPTTRPDTVRMMFTIIIPIHDEEKLLESLEVDAPDEADVDDPLGTKDHICDDTFIVIAALTASENENSNGARRDAPDSYVMFTTMQPLVAEFCTATDAGNGTYTVLPTATM